MLSMSPSVSGERADSRKQFTPDDALLARLYAPHPVGLAAHQSGLELLDGPEGPAQGLDVRQFGLGGLNELGRLGLYDLGSLEDVAVLEEVGLEGQDLLDPQRPLLVPGAGQAEGLVPGRQLQGAGPGARRQGHPERLEHDPRHVVLGLLLGQSERVDLHPVAETTELGVGDAVALGADAVPHGGEGPHLAGLLHEADTGVDEEADPADHGG